MDGKYKYGLEGERTLGGDAKPGRVDATGQKHRPQIEVGRDVVEIEDFPYFLRSLNNVNIALTHHRHLLRVCPSPLVEMNL